MQEHDRPQQSLEVAIVLPTRFDFHFHLHQHGVSEADQNLLESVVARLRRLAAAVKKVDDLTPPPRS